MSKLIDLSGQRFGRLIAIKRVEDMVNKNGKHETMWLCRCDCGNEIVTRARQLRCGNKKSCGCLQREFKIKHGCMIDSKQLRLYQIWINIKARCYNPNNKCYKNYGARGITVCEEWVNNFGAFSAWSYENGYDDKAIRGKCTIDRIDNSIGYSPNNCRWVNQKIQNNNKRCNIHIEYNGETHTIAEWAMLFNINYLTLYNRIFTYKWSLDDAFHKPIKEKNT